MLHFFGDSIGMGKLAVPASWYLADLTSVTNHAVAGADLDAIKGQIQAASFAPGDIAVINGGVNDLALGSTPAQVDSKMQDCVDAVPAGYAYRVLPVFPYLPQASNISAANALLQTRFGNEFDSTVFAALEDPVTSGLLLKYYGVDGLHLSPAGQRVVAESLHNTLFTPDPTLWRFPSLSADITDGLTPGTASPCLGRRWEVWHSPIGYDGSKVSTIGYAGALAALQTAPDNFTMRANVALNRTSQHSWFSFVSRATPTEWIQSGFNFAGQQLRVAHWKSLVHTNNLTPPVDDFEFKVAANKFFDARVDIELSLSHFDGDVYLAVNGEPVLQAAIPGTLPGDKIGVWIRDCHVHSLTIEDLQCLPLP